MKREYLQLHSVEGPLIVLEGIDGATYGEIIEIKGADQKIRKGKVIKIDNKMVVAQVFEGTSGLRTQDTRVRFTGKPFEMSLSQYILGRRFNGVGQPIDGGGPILAMEKRNINGGVVNPVMRRYPRNYVQTGVSSIDTLITLIRGQKLPIFSGSGLPHNELAAQIAAQAKLAEGSNDKFAIVFAAIGVKHDDASYFKHAFESQGVSNHVVMFENLADDPIVERVSVPRCAMTAAEYLAYEEGYHVLVIMTDLTSYCEALREIASAREEIPSRKGYPGYLYSDLASIYERAGMVKKAEGSVTLLPILTMPNDDMSHPIPDLTGYITEGQIVLSRHLHNLGVYPPVNVLPSLSRLMKDGIGEGYTTTDHPDVASQLFMLYSKVQDIRGLAQIIGENDLSETDKKYMLFGRAFENEFVNQGLEENRSIYDSLKLAWQLLKLLPKSELTRLSEDIIRKHL